MTRTKFKSITVEEGIYEKFAKFARDKELTIAAFLKKLAEQYENIATLPLLRLGVMPLEVVWPKHAWKYGEPFKGIFDDPGIHTYKSIAWIQSAEYVQKAGGPQWPDELKKRIAGDEIPTFTFKKMLLMSRDARETLEAWEWVFWWLQIKSHCPPGRVHVFVVNQEDAEKWKKSNWPRELEDLRHYNDFGIYGDKAIGFLEIAEESEPETYRWRLNPKSGGEGEAKADETTDGTQKLFDKLMNAADSMFDFLAEHCSRSESEIRIQLAEKLKG
jgi:hypothetical protein